MEETFIGGKGSIRDGRKSFSLREVAQKVFPVDGSNIFPLPHR